MVATMDLQLSQSEIALQTRARAFVRELPARARPRSTATSSIPGTSSKALAEAGFCGMTIPQAYGGQGRSFLDAVLVIEEMAQGLLRDRAHRGRDQYGRDLAP